MSNDTKESDSLFDLFEYKKQENGVWIWIFVRKIHTIQELVELTKNINVRYRISQNGKTFASFNQFVIEKWK